MPRPTISELEAILDREEQQEIEILPNGEIRAKNTSTAQERQAAQTRKLSMPSHIAAKR